jgi:hypothetical protein
MGDRNYRPNTAEHRMRERWKLRYIQQLIDGD